MSTKLVWITPDAEKVIGYCARVSNPANQDNPDVTRLLRYCASDCSSDSPTSLLRVPGVFPTLRDSDRGHRCPRDAPRWRSQPSKQPTFTEDRGTHKRAAGCSVSGRFFHRVLHRRLSRSHRAGHGCGDCSHGVADVHSDNDVHERHHPVLDTLRAAAYTPGHAARTSGHRAGSAEHYA